MASGVVAVGDVPPSISFSGSGFMATYQLGVAQCLLHYVPWILRTAPYVLGASAGSLVAATVVCEISPTIIRDEIIYFAKQMRAFPLGPFNPSINVFHWLECVLNKHLPADAHQLACGRLAVAMTRLTDGERLVTTQFQSKEDVVQALLCSCYVPGYCGITPPSFKGEYYLDGGFSSMQPVAPAPRGHTLTVCPFSGETDICPSDTSSAWDMVVSGSTLKGNVANSVRVINALYPMALETLEQAFYRGYKDTTDYLLRNDLAPYLIMRKIPQGAINCDQNKRRMHLEIPEEEEEEEGEEEEDKASLTSFTDNRLLQLNHLVLQRRQRHAAEVVFWLWCCLRHLIFFFFNVFFCSLKKNMEDRVLPLLVLLKWLKIQTQYDALQGRRDASSMSASSENIKQFFVPRQFITFPPDYKNKN